MKLSESCMIRIYNATLSYILRNWNYYINYIIQLDQECILARI